MDDIFEGLTTLAKICRPCGTRIWHPSILVPQGRQIFARDVNPLYLGLNLSLSHATSNPLIIFPLDTHQYPPMQQYNKPAFSFYNNIERLCEYNDMAKSRPAITLPRSFAQTYRP